MNNSLVKLETDRLWLVALTDAWLKLAGSHWPLLEQALDLNPSTFEPDDTLVRAMLMKRINIHNDRERWLWCTYWLLILKSENHSAGVCGFKGPPNIEGAVEIGYGTHPHDRNRGYMTEAVCALVDWAFETPVVERVIAETLINNPASRRVLEKCGFAFYKTEGDSMWWQKFRTT